MNPQQLHIEEGKFVRTQYHLNLKLLSMLKLIVTLLCSRLGEKEKWFARTFEHS